MKTVNASTFKAKCLTILDEVAEGAATYVITKRGREVAVLLPPASGDRTHPQLSLRGTVQIVGDIVSPVVPPDAWTADAANLGPSVPSSRRTSRRAKRS